MIDWQNKPSTLTPINRNNLNRMQTELLETISKDYTGNNITANTKLGYGTIHMAKAITNVIGTGTKSPTNPYKIETTGDDINIFDGELELGNINNGENVDASTCIRSVNYISITPNTNCAISNNNNYQMNLSYYDTSYNFISTAVPNNGLFTTPSNCYYIRFSTAQANQENNLNTKFKLQKGSTITTWSPYGYGTVRVVSSTSGNTSSNIVYVNNPLYCLKNNSNAIIAQDWINYDTRKIVKNCDVLILNGTENYSLNNTIDTDTLIGFNVAISRRNLKNRNTCISNMFKNIAGDFTASEEHFSFNSTYNNLTFVVSKSTASTVNEFKNLVREKNICIISELATAEYKDNVECLNKIKQYPNTTTIQSNANLELTLTNDMAIATLNEDIKKATEIIVSAIEPTGENRRKRWIRHSANLYNPATRTVGELINSGGTSVNINFIHSDYIKVNNNETVTVVFNKLSNGQIGIIEFDKDKNYVKENFYDFRNTAADDRFSIVTKYNTAYVIVNYRKDLNMGDMMFLRGSSIIPYEPYVEDAEFVLNASDMYQEITKEEINVIPGKEYKTGRKRNGKIEYCCEVYGTLANTTDGTYTNSTIDISLLHADDIRIAGADLIDGTTTLPLPLISGGNVINAFTNKNVATLRNSISFYNGKQVRIVLEYTKTRN